MFKQIQRHQRALTLFAAFLLPILIMGGYFMTRGMAPFGKSTILTVDLGQQYVDFFAYFRRALLHHPSSFFYSFAKGLGGEMWGTNAYYLWSPLNLVLLFFPGRSIASGILLLTLLKYGFAGLSMAWFLDRQKLQSGLRAVSFAVAYALMGWMIANQLNLLWLDVLFILPPLVDGLIRILNGQRPWRYVGWLTFCLIDNYYMAWMVCLFTILFACWQLSSKSYPWQVALRRGGIYIGSSLLSVANAAVVLLPTVITLLSSKGTYTENKWKPVFEYKPWKLLAKFIPGSFNFIQMPSGQANIYVGVIVTLGALLFFTNKHQRWQSRVVAFLISALFALSFCWQPLDLLWHIGQFPVWYPSRFSYLASFWLIWLAAQTLTPDYHLRWQNACWLIALVVLVNGWLFFHLKQINYLSKAQLLMGIGLVAASLLWLSLPRHEYQLVIDGVMLMITCLDLGTNATLSLNNLSYVPEWQFGQYTNELNEAAKRLPTGPRTFYRVGKTFQRTKDDPFQAGFNSGDHFGSTMRPQTPNFMAAIGQPEGDGFVTYSNGTQVTDALLDFQYFMSARHGGQQDQVQILPLTSNRPDLRRMKKVGPHGLINLSYNRQALPIAFAANRQILQFTQTTADPVMYQSQLFQTLAGRAAAVPLFTVQNFNHVTFQNVSPSQKITGTIFRRLKPLKDASITLSIIPNTNDSYYLTLGDELKDNATIYLNGHRLHQYPNFRNTIVTNVAYHDRGKHIKVKIKLRHAALWCQNVSLYRLNQRAFNSSLKQLQQAPLHLTAVSPAKISGTVNIPNAQSVLMTTIPNEAGWQVLVDGQRVAHRTAAGMFIAVPMVPGHHRVTFRYRPPFIWPGLLVSLISLASCYWLARKQHQ